MRLAPGFAAVAIICGAVACGSSRHNESGEVSRAELVGLIPGGSTSSLEFKWESPFAAAQYRLVVRDVSGTLAYSGDTTATSMNIDSAERTRFATMVEYSWTVTAVDASGAVLGESKPRTFTYQP